MDNIFMNNKPVNVLEVYFLQFNYGEIKKNQMPGGNTARS